MNLDKLGQLHNTDKSSRWHDYLRVYENYLSPLRFATRRVLEIGVGDGASLRMWNDYFAEAQIFGIDCNPECSKLQIGPRVKIVAGDVLDPSMWSAFEARCGRDFDIVVDDGAHTPKSISAVLTRTFGLIRPGGLYICEDLHAIYHSEYYQDSLPDGRSLWDLFLGYVHEMNTFGEPLCGDPESACSCVSFVHFYRSLCIIGKN